MKLLGIFHCKKQKTILFPKSLQSWEGEAVANTLKCHQLKLAFSRLHSSEATELKRLAIAQQPTHVVVDSFHLFRTERKVRKMQACWAAQDK